MTTGQVYTNFLKVVLCFDILTCDSMDSVAVVCNTVVKKGAEMTRDGLR